MVYITLLWECSCSLCVTDKSQTHLCLIKCIRCCIFSLFQRISKEWDTKLHCLFWPPLLLRKPILPSECQSLNLLTYFLFFFFQQSFYILLIMSNVFIKRMTFPVFFENHKIAWLTFCESNDLEFPGAGLGSLTRRGKNQRRSIENALNA